MFRFMIRDVLWLTVTLVGCDASIHSSSSSSSGHTNADGHFRQAMVLCWMMMPRIGGRKVTDALKIVTQIFERNLIGWAEDEATFTGKKAAKKQRRRTP